MGALSARKSEGLGEDEYNGGCFDIGWGDRRKVSVSDLRSRQWKT